MSKSHPCCSTHCCKFHGCKYRYEDCPVVNLEEEQEYPCEECGLETEGYYDFCLDEEDSDVLRKICSITKVVVYREQLKIILKEYLEKLQKGIA